MKRPLIVGLLGLIIFGGHAQQLIEGKVFDQYHEPIPFVTIGIRGKNIGTYSFENGSFSLRISESHLNDTLTFSCIGYEISSMSIYYLLSSGQNIITLQESISHLDEVIITSNNTERTTRILGILKNKSDSDVSISNPHKGAEVGLVIEAEEYPVYINKITVKFKALNLDSVRLQARIYTLDQSGLPASTLSYKLIKTVISEETQCQFDLVNPYEIKHPVFISFQWLVSEWEAIKLDNLNTFQQALILKYVPEKCTDCSVTIYDKKKISVQDQQGNEIESIKMKKVDITALKAMSSKAPHVAFLTCKKAGTTLYRSYSLGKWYRYDQNLIAWVIADI